MNKKIKNKKKVDTKKLFKKIIYYIFLTMAFVALPMTLRNIYISFLVSANILTLIMNTLLFSCAFVGPFSIALVIRFIIKNGYIPFLETSPFDKE